MPKVTSASDDLIPTAEVARMLGRDVATIARWVRSGKLTPTVKTPGIRGAMMFSRAAVEALASDKATA